MTQTIPLVVSVKEAAKLIGVCPKTVANLIAVKELVSRKIGRRRVIPMTSLEALMKRDSKTQRVN